MSRTAKISDLTKKDLNNFSIGLTEARKLKITKEDLKGIKEIIPNEKYQIRLTNGSRQQLTINATLLDTIKKKNELSKTKDNNVDNSKPDMLFKDAIPLYIDYLYERELRGDIDINTLFDHFKKIETDILDFFGNYRLSEITSELMEQFIDYLRKRKNKNDTRKKLSEQTIKNNVRSLNAVINFFVNKRLMVINPYKYVTNKPNPKRHKKELNIFKLEDAKYALKCLDKYADIRLKTFMNIIFSLGCRREEACGLRWCDIDFVNKEVNFNYAKTSNVPKSFLKMKAEYNKTYNVNTNNSYNRIRTKELKTNNSYRTNFLSDLAIQCLKNYYNFKISCGISIKATDSIFTTYLEGKINPKDGVIKDIRTDNKPVDPNKMTIYWRNFKKLYNIKDVDLHRIRHTVANILEKKGIPKKDIAKMLGNTERVLEEYYTHVDVQDMQRLRNTLDSELYKDVKFIDLDIDLVAKILNEYPMDSLTEEELKKLDLVTNEAISFDNYNSSISRIKDIILTYNGNLNFFIDDNVDNLKIKVDCYKRFKNNETIKIQREKDLSIKKDIMSF